MMLNFDLLPKQKKTAIFGTHIIYQINLQRMLFQVLDPVCCHLSLGAWNRLVRTCKNAKKAIDTPLYWDGRYHMFQNDVMHSKGELYVYRSIQCHCEKNNRTRRRPSFITAIGMFIIKKQTTKEFMQYMVKEVNFLNCNILPLIGHQNRTAHIFVQLPMAQWHKIGYEMVGKTQLLPYTDFQDKEIAECFENIPNNPENNTLIVLDETVQENLDPGSLGTLQNGEHCPDCGRIFAYDGLFGYLINY